MIAASFIASSPSMLRINDMSIRNAAEPKLRQCLEYVLSRLGEEVDGNFQQDDETYKCTASLSNARIAISWTAGSGLASLVLEDAPPSLQNTWRELLPELSREVIYKLNQIVPEILRAQV